MTVTRTAVLGHAGGGSRGGRHFDPKPDQEAGQQGVFELGLPGSSDATAKALASCPSHHEGVIHPLSHLLGDSVSRVNVSTHASTNRSSLISRGLAPKVHSILR